MKIAIIPARGGSKRIPGKNIKSFCGKPIIAYSIQAAIESGIFDEVMISTDSQQIADIGTEFGASIPFMRSKQNSNDHATIIDVMQEVVKWYDENRGNVEVGCGIYATAPFIQPEDLLRSYKKLIDDQRDSLLAITKFSVPIQKAFKMTEGSLSWFFDNFDQDRTQDLAPSYQDAGQFFWFKGDKLRKSGIIVGDNTAGYEIDPMSVQDIDTLEDWEIGEFKYQFLKSKEK